MNNLEKYLDQVIVQRSANANLGVPQMRPESASDAEPTVNVLGGLLRRWHIVLLTFLVLCAAGIPAIWLLIERSYTVTGAIRVAPILTSILTGEEEVYGGTQVYQSFLYSQAAMVTNARVLQRVASDLADKELKFFEDRTNRLAMKLQRLNPKDVKPEPADVLKEAILEEVITVAPVRRGEHILVSMKWTDAEEAKMIVDAFIRLYIAVEVTSAEEKEMQGLGVLQSEERLLSGKLDSYRADIFKLAEEYGSKKLDSRYDMNLQRVGSLLAQLTEVEARRIYLETQVKLLEQTHEETVPLQEWVSIREDYVNKDTAVQVLTSSIVALDQELITDIQTLAATNPQIKQKEELLKILRTRLIEQKEKTREAFAELMKEETASQSKKKLADLKVTLEQTQAHETELRNLLSKEDTQTINLGQKNLAIQDLEDKLAFTKEMYDKISRRIAEFEMERKRPARITVGYDADIAGIRDKRAKYTMALIFGSMACGMLLAFLREKADHSLRTPDDVVERIGLRIIGTTTSTHTIKPARLTEHVAEDYQTIRANLGLLDGNGMPRNLVVTSPGMREGKTTFAINLAISVSKSGRRVLLIDGDLRNPNIASLLGLPKGSRGLQDVLLGKGLHQAVYSVPQNGLDVLAADSGNTADAFELLASSLTAQRLNEISQSYDHVIIDTPPVLAFADALIWAKSADAVILTSFAGQTTGPDLKKAKERLAQINANVLGTVLSNVEVGHRYYPYGYDYTRNVRSKTNARQAHRKMLLPMQTPKPKADGS